MEQFLQETSFQTDKSRHTIHLIAQIAEFGSSPDHFLAQVTSLTPHSQPFVSVRCFPLRYPEATEAFQAAFEWLRSYATRNGETITSIDNPCNCPFISKNDQQSILAATGLHLPVQVNGQ